MPTGDVYKVSLFTHGQQRQFINTHYYEVGAINPVNDFDEAQALAETFEQAFTALYQAALSDDTEFGCVKVEKVVGPRIPFYIFFYANKFGSAVGGALPDNLTMVVRRRANIMGQDHRSLLHISGMRHLDVAGSFLEAAFVAGPFAALIAKYNDLLISSPGFNSAEWKPVIPSTPYVYFRKTPVTVNTTAQTITRNDGKKWDTEGFVNGPQFRINAPSKNKGLYTATTAPLSSVITLSDNELETESEVILSGQQATGPRIFVDLQSAVPQVAIRSLKQRRSSHTAIVA